MYMWSPITLQWFIEVKNKKWHGNNGCKRKKKKRKEKREVEVMRKIHELIK